MACFVSCCCVCCSNRALLGAPAPLLARPSTGPTQHLRLLLRLHLLQARHPAARQRDHGWSAGRDAGGCGAVAVAEPPAPSCQRRGTPGAGRRARPAAPRVPDTALLACLPPAGWQPSAARSAAGQHWVPTGAAVVHCRRLPQLDIPPFSSQLYDFICPTAGLYWYHSHYKGACPRPRLPAQSGGAEWGGGRRAPGARGSSPCLTLRPAVPGRAALHAVRSPVRRWPDCTACRTSNTPPAAQYIDGLKGALLITDAQRQTYPAESVAQLSDWCVWVWACGRRWMSCLPCPLPPRPPLPPPLLLAPRSRSLPCRPAWPARPVAVQCRGCAAQRHSRGLPLPGCAPPSMCDAGTTRLPSASSTTTSPPPARATVRAACAGLGCVDLGACARVTQAASLPRRSSHKNPPRPGSRPSPPLPSNARRAGAHLRAHKLDRPGQRQLHHLSLLLLGVPRGARRHLRQLPHQGAGARCPVVVTAGCWCVRRVRSIAAVGVAWGVEPCASYLTKVLARSQCSEVAAVGCCRCAC